MTIWRKVANRTARIEPLAGILCVFLPIFVGFCDVSNLKFLDSIHIRWVQRTAFTFFGDKAVSTSDRLVRCREALHRDFRVHIEQSPTGSGPGVALPLEHRAGVADAGDRSDFFHITAFDRFKSQVNGNQQIRLHRRAITE